jgi:hypothetical protein
LHRILAASSLPISSRIEGNFSKEGQLDGLTQRSQALYGLQVATMKASLELRSFYFRLEFLVQQGVLKVMSLRLKE